MRLHSPPPQQQEQEDGEVEEVLAIHSDSGDGGGRKEEEEELAGLVVNERFEEDPVGYFSEKVRRIQIVANMLQQQPFSEVTFFFKERYENSIVIFQVMSALFRRVWSSLLSEEAAPLVDAYGERIIQESLEMQSLSSRESSAVPSHRRQQQQQQPQQHQRASVSSATSLRSRAGSRFQNRRETAIDSIDENQVFHGGGGIAIGGGRMIQVGGFEDDGGDPISLPNLTSSSSTAAPPSMERRPFSSQVSGRGLGLGGGR